MQINEFQIPVPWGHVAVKAWGNKENEPILAFHGLQDNAGTFDRLLPHLPATYYYICIDLPSHGLSSPFPLYLPIHTTDYLLVYKIILDFFNYKKCIILGHSYGAQIGLMFTECYPEIVTKLIMLDTIHMYPISVDNFKQFVQTRHDQIIKINKKLLTSSAPKYTYDEALLRLMEGRLAGELTKEAAEALLIRAVAKTEDGLYQFNTDQRLKAFMNPTIDRRYGISLLKLCPVKCPVLLILASETAPIMSYFEPVLKELKKNKHCIVKRINGSHDVHNINPDMVAPIITKFLTYKKHKL